MTRNRPLPPLPKALTKNIPRATPITISHALMGAQLRLKEFMENSISLSEGMGPVITDLTLKFISKDTWPNKFLALPEIERKLWLQSLEKTIEKCKKIQEVVNPFRAAMPSINKEAFTLNDYKDAIALIHSQSLDNKHNHGLKKRAINCLWLTLFFPTLMANPINIEHLRSSLIKPFQRIVWLSLYSKDGTDDYNKLCAESTVAENLPDNFKQIESQFQKLTARSITIAKASNCFNTILDELIKISKNWLKPNDFHLFLIEVESNLLPHIEHVVSLILNEEIAEERVIDYIKNTFSSFLKEKFHLQFSDKLVNWACKEINNAIVKAEGDRPSASDRLENSLNLIREDNSLSDLQKTRNMVDEAERIVNGIESTIKLNNNTILFEKSKLVDALKPVIDNISNVINYLQPQPICEFNLQNNNK